MTNPLDACPVVLSYTGSPDPTKGPGRRLRFPGSRIKYVVLHVNVGPEVKGGAVSLAGYLAQAHPNDYPAYHGIVDDAGCVRTASDDERVNGAGGVADIALHLCLIGRADQTAEQWADAYSTAELERGAQIVRAWCDEYDLAKRRLSPSELSGGLERGIVGHVDVSAVWKRSNSGHYDPGPNFPWAKFLEAVIDAPAPPSTTNPVSLEAKTMIVFKNDVHYFWISADDHLQHDWPGGHEDMDKYGIKELYDATQGVEALVAPNGNLEVRAVAKDRTHMLAWTYNVNQNTPGWGARSTPAA